MFDKRQFGSFSSKHNLGSEGFNIAESRIRLLEGADLMKQNTEGIHVGWETIFFSGTNFVGHVSRGTGKAQLVSDLFNVLQVAGNTKVKDLDNSIRVKTQVFWFQITKDNCKKK